MKRSEKATGKYKDYWYIKNERTGEIDEYNVEELDDWKIRQEQTEEPF